MKIPESEYIKIFELLLKDLSEQEKKVVLILVSNECDSVCSLKLLTVKESQSQKCKNFKKGKKGLLKGADIEYIILPVSNHQFLLENSEDLLKDNKEISNIVLINCGAIIDLYDFLSIGSRGIKNVIVADYHRPFHLVNVENKQQIFLLDTQLTNGEEDFVGEEEEDRDSSDDYNSSEEEEGGNKKRRLNDYFNSDNSDKLKANENIALTNNTNNTNNINNTNNTNNQHFSLSKLEKLKRQFSRGAFYGFPSTSLFFHLYKQLGKQDLSSLWLSIVALTSHLIHQRTSLSHYHLHLSLLRKQVEEISNEGSSQGEKEGSEVGASGLRGDQVRRVELEYVDELRLDLLRHWSLYESMYHSRYFASRLGIWRENGRMRLQELLAKIGIPLSECKQEYACMSLEDQQLVLKKLEKYSKSFRLNQIYFPTFVLKQPFKATLSASDVVHSVNALLQIGISTQVSDLHLRENPASSNSLNDSFDWQNNFWKAFDAISSRKGEKGEYLEKGIRSAILLQQAIVRQGIDMLVKKVIVRTGPFRYVLINHSSQLELFSHPPTLVSLSLFLIDTLRTHKKSSKPIVVAALNKNSNSYLVVGVTPVAPDDPKMANTFGRCFRNAAKKTNSTINLHFFDSSVIEIKAQDVNKFLEFLHSDLV